MVLFTYTFFELFVLFDAYELFFKEEHCIYYLGAGIANSLRTRLEA